MDDEALMKQVADDDDVEAFAELLSRYDKFIGHICWRKGMSPNAAEKAIQQVVSALWKERKDYPFSDAFHIHLIRLVDRHCRKRWSRSPVHRITAAPGQSVHLRLDLPRWQRLMLETTMAVALSALFFQAESPITSPRFSPSASISAFEQDSLVPRVAPPPPGPVSVEPSVAGATPWPCESPVDSSPNRVGKSARRRQSGPAGQHHPPRLTHSEIPADVCQSPTKPTGITGYPARLSHSTTPTGLEAHWAAQFSSSMLSTPNAARVVDLGFAACDAEVRRYPNSSFRCSLLFQQNLGISRLYRASALNEMALLLSRGGF